MFVRSLPMTTDFAMQAGIPFARSIRITDGKNVWTNLGDFEVRSQLRTGRSPSYSLIVDLGQYMTKAFDGNDIVVTWSMTGEDVRDITKNGYYDLIVSDLGVEDSRAILVLAGQIRVANTVTSAAGAS